MSCHENYLKEFFNDPKNTDEYKVNFLKKNYFSIVNCYFNIELKDFLIGAIKNNNNLIYFATKINDKKLIYNIKEKKYYKKINNNLFEINLNDYKVELFIENKRMSCLNNKICIIL